MCLIITGPVGRVRRVLLDTPGLIEDIYQRNSDGLGVMHPTPLGGGVIVRRELPKSAQHARSIIESLPRGDRPVAMHWRWRTHGDIDMGNCHPYQIEGGYLMHNGILQHGNGNDPSKSDTWHYCRDYLQGGALAAIAGNQHLQALVADHIGANKFVILTDDARMITLNEDQGFEAGGLWWSNTYAWTPGLVDPSYRPPAPRWSRLHMHLHDLPMRGAPMGIEGYDTMGVESAWEQDSEVQWEPDDGYIEDVLASALDVGDVETLQDLIDSYGADTIIRTLFDQPWTVEPLRTYDDPHGLAPLIFKRDAHALIAACERGGTAHVAEALAHYTAWDFTPATTSQCGAPHATTPAATPQP